MSQQREPGSAPGLRARARSKLGARGDPADAPAGPDAQALLYELRLHEVELEMQNEELRRATLELRTAHDDLARAEQHYRDLYENAPVAYVTLDGNGRIAAANRSATTLLGGSARPLLGRRFSDFVTADHQDAWHRCLRSLFRGRAPRPLAITLEATGGSRIHAELAGAVGPDADTLRIALLDVTERERAEQAARESERRVRVITDALPVLVSYVDAEERYRFVNAAYETWFGIRPDDVRGRTLRDVLGEAAYEAVEPHTRAALGGAAARFEREIPYRHAGARYVSAVYSPDVDPAGHVQGFYAVIHDLTALRRAESALRATAAEAALAEQRERRALAADLHDDVGQLLSLASLELSALADATAREEQAALFFKTRDLVARARERVSSLSFQLSPPILHDVGLVAAAQWLGEDLAGSFRLEVHVEAPDGELTELDEALRITLFRALRELLINVARHAQTPRAQVEIRRRDAFAEVEVADDGVGFDPDTAFRGFGLRGVRDRVEHMGGSVRIDASPGGGTRIVARAPLARTPISNAPERGDP